jgi:hypothetical protein
LRYRRAMLLGHLRLPRRRRHLRSVPRSQLLDRSAMLWWSRLYGRLLRRLPRPRGLLHELFPVLLQRLHEWRLPVGAGRAMRPRRGLPRLLLESELHERLRQRYLSGVRRCLAEGRGSLRRYTPPSHLPGLRPAAGEGFAQRHAREVPLLRGMEGDHPAGHSRRSRSKSRGHRRSRSCRRVAIARRSASCTARPRHAHDRSTWPLPASLAESMSRALSLSGGRAVHRLHPRTRAALRTPVRVREAGGLIAARADDAGRIGGAVRLAPGARFDVRTETLGV